MSDIPPTADQGINLETDPLTSDTYAQTGVLASDLLTPASPSIVGAAGSINTSSLLSNPWLVAVGAGLILAALLAVAGD